MGNASLILMCYDNDWVDIHTFFFKLESDCLLPFHDQTAATILIYFAMEILFLRKDLGFSESR